MNIAAAKKHLRSCDPILGAVVDRIDLTDRGQETDVWCALVSSILGQQISVHAARAIRGRFAALEPGRDFPSPQFVLAANDDALRSVGLSRNKILSIRDLAAHMVDGRINSDAFTEMSDEDVIAALIPVRGIGRWTAEMFLIFNLGREDVLAVDDLGLRNAIKRLYALDSLSPAEMRRIAEPWRPYRSLASWYLWQSLNNQPVVATDEATTTATKKKNPTEKTKKKTTTKRSMTQKPVGSQAATRNSAAPSASAKKNAKAGS